MNDRVYIASSKNLMIPNFTHGMAHQNFVFYDRVVFHHVSVPYLIYLIMTPQTYILILSITNSPTIGIRMQESLLISPGYI